MKPNFQKFQKATYGKKLPQSVHYLKKTNPKLFIYFMYVYILLSVYASYSA